MEFIGVVKAWAAIMFAGAVAAFPALPTLAGAPRYENLNLSDAADGTPRTAFTKDTASSISPRGSST